MALCDFSDDYGGVIMCDLNEMARTHKQAKKDAEEKKNAYTKAKADYHRALDYLKDVENSMNMDRNYD